MNIRSRQVWRGYRRGHYADPSDDHHWRHAPGEPLLCSTGRVPTGAARTPRYAEEVRAISYLTTEVEMERPAIAIKRLKACINDLISVLALPAIWSGNEPSQILGTLLDVLLGMLRLDFA